MMRRATRLLRTSCALAAGALVVVALAGCRAGSTGRTAAVTPRAADGCATRARAAGDTTETLASGGLTRSYILHVPADYIVAPTPVVLLFHGYGLTADFMRRYTRLSDVSDQHRFVLVIPNGSSVPQYWNSNGVPGGPDDVGFVRDLLAKLATEVCVDPARVYAAGYSNGGGMAQLLACRLPQQIAAVALVASENAGCDAAVPLIDFHGTADPVLPYRGSGGLGAGSTGFPPVREFASAWAAGLGCGATPVVSVPAPDIELMTYGGCAGGGSAVQLYAVRGGGHTWPGAAFQNDGVGPTTQSISASALMWDFFAAHPLR